MGPIPHCCTGTQGPCWFESPCPINDEDATAQTVREMCEVIRACAQDPLIINEARRCFDLTSMCRLGSYRDIAAHACYRAAKARLKFRLDEITLNRLLNKRGERDFLQWPSLVVRGKVKEGDCDCFTMFMLALLSVLEVPWRIVTVKCDPKDPDRWAHVYAVIDLEDGQRLPLDASHFQQPGQEVPAHHVFEYAEWDESGNRVPVSFNPIPMQGYRWKGLGQDPAVDGTDWTPTDSGLTDSGLTTDQLAALTNASATGTQDAGLITPIYQNPISVPQSSGGISPQLASALTTLGIDWTKIAGQTIAPQTNITTPQGLNISGPSNAISSLFGGTGANLLGSSTASLGPILLIGGLGIGALLLFSALGKK